jgi:hypothetical protein
MTLSCWMNYYSEQNRVQFIFKLEFFDRSEEIVVD